MIPHGTHDAYCNHGCRCDACRNAQAVYQSHLRHVRRVDRMLNEIDWPGGPVDSGWIVAFEDCSAKRAERLEDVPALVGAVGLVRVIDLARLAAS